MRLQLRKIQLSMIHCDFDGNARKLQGNVSCGRSPPDDSESASKYVWAIDGDDVAGGEPDVLSDFPRDFFLIIWEC
jgi:hypothetical protein